MAKPIFQQIFQKQTSCYHKILKILNNTQERLRPCCDTASLDDIRQGSSGDYSFVRASIFLLMSSITSSVNSYFEMMNMARASRMAGITQTNQRIPSSAKAV